MRVIQNKTILKNSFVLVEVIFSVVLFSIVLIYTLNSTLSIEKSNKKSYDRLTSIIKLESTKLFLEKNNIPFSNIVFDNGILKYNDNILLNGVFSYTLTTNDDLKMVDICLKNNICQKWYFR